MSRISGKRIDLLSFPNLPDCKTMEAWKVSAVKPNSVPMATHLSFDKKCYLKPFQCNCEHIWSFQQCQFLFGLFIGFAPGAQSSNKFSTDGKLQYGVICS